MPREAPEASSSSSQERAAKKRKAPPAAVVVDAPPNPIVGMLRECYGAPLVDEHVSGRSAQVLAHSIMEQMHKSLVSHFQRGTSIASLDESARKAVDDRIKELLLPVTEEPMAGGLRMLQQAISAEMAGTLERDYAMQKQMVAGVPIGEDLRVADATTDGCMFKVLRKLLCIAQLQKGSTLRTRKKEDTKNALLKHTKAMGGTYQRKQNYVQELEMLKKQEQKIQGRQLRLAKMEEVRVKNNKPANCA